MLQHLLNSTAIWLLSLMVFDIFLRRERYHAYNRIYLLFSLFTGAFLPLWEWNEGSIIDSSGMTIPVERAAVIRENIAVNTLPATQTDWFLIAYLAGVAFSMALLLREVLIITTLYRNGDKSKDGVWTVVETGENHTPFSAFRYVFINNRNNYSPEELRMILTHEEQHGHLLHFVDLVLIQLAKVIFWFHPLVYMYHARLMMVHEYQADAAVDRTPAEYGHFLVEQAILGKAPVLSHSFNRSPIKKRIEMLTRKTSTLAKGKQLVIAPLLLACLVFFTQKGFSEDVRKDGNKLYYKGNVFELWGPATNDTVMVEDPVTGEWILKIARADSIPVKMNGNYIFRTDELSRPEREELIKTRLAIQEFILNEMQPAFDNLPDGTYIMNVSNVILDERGKIVFFNRPFVMNNADPNALSTQQTKELIDRLKATLNTSNSFNAITRGGKPVIFNIESLYDLKNLIIIRDHKRR